MASIIAFYKHHPETTSTIIPGQSLRTGAWASVRLVCDVSNATQHSGWPWATSPRQPKPAPSCEPVVVHTQQTSLAMSMSQHGQSRSCYLPSWINDCAQTWWTLQDNIYNCIDIERRTFREKFVEMSWDCRVNKSVWSVFTLLVCGCLLTFHSSLVTCLYKSHRNSCLCSGWCLSTQTLSLLT